MDTFAYTLNVAKTNLNDVTEIGTATVNMSISPSWVAAHGGVNKVKILRYADDGTYQVLDTRFVGMDSPGNMVFTVISPGGLSIFALVSVKSPPAEAAVTQQPPSQILTAILLLPVTGANAVLIIPPLVVLVIILFIRRKRKKEK